MWNPDEEQAQYGADMAAQAEHEMQMEAMAAYAEHEAEMENERNQAISELEDQIRWHENEIAKLQRHIENISK